MWNSGKSPTHKAIQLLPLSHILFIVIDFFKEKNKRRKTKANQNKADTHSRKFIKDRRKNLKTITFTNDKRIRKNFVCKHKYISKKRFVFFRKPSGKFKNCS